MTVTSDRRGPERVIVVDGDLSCPATLVQLRATLSSHAFTEDAPVVVDMTTASGTSPAVGRLLERATRLMAHRGIAFRVDAPRLVRV